RPLGSSNARTFGISGLIELERPAAHSPSRGDARRRGETDGALTLPSPQLVMCCLRNSGLAVLAATWAVRLIVKVPGRGVAASIGGAMTWPFAMRGQQPSKIRTILTRQRIRVKCCARAHAPEDLQPGRQLPRFRAWVNPLQSCA